MVCGGVGTLLFSLLTRIIPKSMGVFNAYLMNRKRIGDSKEERKEKEGAL